ncbi:MAG: hypothetical protein LKH33_06720 [Acetobacter sp.]|nr:hypothetical protein [Acetobacter sp.]MCH4060471.1 hypothetical protein [Acetobacter sp.]MCH4087411.1 hypothetical protein [Acetobacter sp.]MCI1293929.1 hypothetical protein [Acetobacter sp.]MCI1320477.1 hypothetical protein [Acetobacter sp.]
MSDTSSLPLAAVMRAHFPSVSHETFRTLNGERCIRVNDHVAADGWAPVSPGDVISILSKDGGLVATFRARGGLHSPDATPEKPACQPDAVRRSIRRFADGIRHPPRMVNETRMVGLAGAVAHTRRDKEDDDCWQVCWRYRRWRDFVAHVLVAGWPRLYREDAR